MAGGADVIYQGALLGAPWHGFSDFLLRVNHTPSSLGDYAYEVADTKLAHQAKPKHVVQLCVYSRLIAAEQGVMPTHTHIVLGNGERVSLRVADFLHYCDIARERFESFVTPPIAGTTAEPCGHCGMCRWHARCDAEWEAADHLSLVANISRSQIKKLHTAGVTTMGQLGALPTSATIPKVQTATLDRLRQQARLQSSKRASGADSIELLAVTEGRGFGRLPRPSDGDLFFDMEGDPLYDDGGLEYLFGFNVRQGDDTRFVPFWAHDRAAEQAAFEGAVDLITARLAADPHAHVYHYAAYEESALKRLAMRHGTREAEVDGLLRNNKLVDLYKVVREGLRTSEPAYSLKNMEHFFAPARQGNVTDAAGSVVVYERWRKLQDPALLTAIGDYNAFDCASTRQCRDWLIGLRPADVAWYTGPPAEPAQADRDAARVDAEQQTAALRQALVNDAPPEDRAWRELVGHLLDYHRREARPEWWEYFTRVGLTSEQLLGDSACLGDLLADPAHPPAKEKRSMVYTFTFPPQEHKFAVGNTPDRAGTGEAAGEIIELDETAGRIRIKVGPSRSRLVDGDSLVPPGPIDDAPLRDAIARFAQAVVNGDPTRYAAVRAVLGRTLPRVTGLAPGDAIVPGTGDPLAECIDAIGRLDDSYLSVQGPPGTGKSTTAAHTIVELLRRHKRVGVASNSHKAINNLLAAIERVAAERGVSFNGVKKSSDADQFLNGTGMIADTTDAKQARSADRQLIAGTAWTFVHPDLDGALDYLFIDEAGQVSLANVVAMGVSARNLVLVGDQMQLSQPTKAVHPGGSGVSALDHLLGDVATVPRERGIFLGVTWRLPPDLCRFVSDTFYEGRLKPAAGNERQRLVWDAPFTLGAGASATDSLALPSSGLRYVPVAHDGCAQDSEEEAEVIRHTFATLLRQRWIDRHGVERAIEVGDVLVVSPYNMQVALLRSVLPAGARVGTVDRFQGQEAAVVLVSMTSSSGEDMPRGVDFLFSRNRLNVAISRARCLAVVFASPRLMEITCRTVDQMRLVNTLCGVARHARGTFPD